MDSNAVLDFYGIPQTACVQGIKQDLHHLYHEIEDKLQRSGKISLEQVGEPFSNIGYRFKKAGDSRGVPPKVHKVWGLENLQGYDTLGHKVLTCKISPLVWYWVQPMIDLAFESGRLCKTLGRKAYPKVNPPGKASLNDHVDTQRNNTCNFQYISTLVSTVLPSLATMVKK